MVGKAANDTLTGSSPYPNTAGEQGKKWANTDAGAPKTQNTGYTEGESTADFLQRQEWRAQEQTPKLHR